MRRFLTILSGLALLALPTVAPAQTRVVVMADGSGTVTTGGTSQQVFAQHSVRIYLMCQNPIAATEPLFVNFGAPASTTGGSVELAPGGSVTFAGMAVPMQTVNVTAATAGHRFVCKAGSQ